MSFVDLIKQFETELGNGITLTPDASNAVVLTVDDMQLTVMGLEEVGLVALTGVIGEPPPVENRETLYAALLKANYNFTGTGGATISINPDSGEVTLCRTLSLELINIETFHSQIEGFVNIMDSWHRIVHDFRGSIEEPEAEETPASAPAGEFGGLGSGFMQV